MTSALSSSPSSNKAQNMQQQRQPFPGCATIKHAGQESCAPSSQTEVVPAKRKLSQPTWGEGSSGDLIFCVCCAQFKIILSFCLVDVDDAEAHRRMLSLCGKRSLKQGEF